MEEKPISFPNIDAKISFIQSADAAALLNFLFDHEIIGPINCCSSELISLKAGSFKSADETQIEIYSKMSFARKWEGTCRLRETAWQLKAAGIRAQHPNWNDIEVEADVRKIFLYATT